MEAMQHKPGDVVNGHVLTSDGTWQQIAGQTAPAPQEHDRFAPPTVLPALQDPPRRRRLRWLWITLSVIGGLFVLLVIIGVATGGGESSAPAAPAGQDQPADADAPAVPEAPPFDAAAYTVLDAAGWAQIAKDPEAARGQKVMVFAEVTQFDSATGNAAFRANVGAKQPAGEFELETNAMLEGRVDDLSAITQGDVLKVYAEVSGALEYETMIGGVTVVPALKVVLAEVVGFLDITGDAQLGTPVWGEYGGVDVPVTIVNSGDATVTYWVDVVAESADGAQQFGTANAMVDNLAPGQTAVTEATFFEDLPTDAVIKVVSVERHSY